MYTNCTENTFFGLLWTFYWMFMFHEVPGSWLVSNYQRLKNSGPRSYYPGFSLNNSRTQMNWNFLGVNWSKPTKSNTYLISNNRHSTSNNEYLTSTIWQTSQLKNLWPQPSIISKYLTTTSQLQNTLTFPAHRPLTGRLALNTDKIFDFVLHLGTLAGGDNSNPTLHFRATLLPSQQ
jgi:hypothetical protein